MVRTRQQSLDLRRSKRGGARHNAGRKPNGTRAGVSHSQRRPVVKRYPLHVTLRVVRDIGYLRRRDCYRAVRQAMVTALKSLETFRICQVSIQGTHIHLIVEAVDRAALSRGMKGFEVSAARRLNAAVRRRLGTQRRGRVFADRYHDEELSSPSQVRNALNYVLNNWRKHGEDRSAPRLQLDPYSSARTFGGFRERPELASVPVDDELLPIAYPSSWLLATGWRKRGTISLRHVPGGR